MPKKVAILYDFKVKHPFYFDIGLVGNIHEDYMLSDYCALLETFRRRITSTNPRNCHLPTPSEEMFLADDSDTSYLVDLYKYIKVCLLLHKGTIQTEIPSLSPNTDDDLPRYYYVYSVYTNMLLKQSLEKEEFLELVEVGALFDDNEFKVNVLNMIRHCLGNMPVKFYLDDSTIDLIRSIFPQESAALEELDSSCAFSRNQFMMQYFTLTGFEHRIWREARLAWTNPDLPLPTSVINHSKISDWPAIDIGVGKSFLEPDRKHAFKVLNIKVRDIASYGAHLNTPGPVSITIRIGILTSDENDSLQDHIYEKLFERNYVNSLGDLIKDNISRGATRVEKDESKRQFFIYYINCLKEYLRTHHSAVFIDYVEAQREIEGQLETAYKQRKLVEEHLATFNAVDAVTLLFQTLRTIPVEGSLPEEAKPCLLSDSIRKPLLSAVCDTLVIAHKAKEILARKIHDPGMHEQAFVLAGRVVSRIKAGNSVVIQSGTPIMVEENKKSSEHAFYVVFKKHETNNQVKIIIVNGGGGLEPEKDPGYDVRDRGFGGNWLCRETEFFELNASTEEFLKHYIYKVIALPYTQATTTRSTPTTGSSREELLENIYLKSGSGFTGKGITKPAFAPPISTSSNSMPSQVFPNCTVYNLKFSLKFLFGWNEAIFSNFIADTVCRFNYLLSTQSAKIEAACAVMVPPPVASPMSGSILREFPREKVGQFVAAEGRLTTSWLEMVQQREKAEDSKKPAPTYAEAVRKSVSSWYPGL